MSMHIVSAAALALALTAPLGHTQSCGQAGTFGTPQISVSSELFDTTSHFAVTGGTPLAPWLWLIDFSPGPIPTPLLTLCTGPSPILLLNGLDGSVPVLDAGGAADIPVPLETWYQWLEGIPLYSQALVLDMGAPGLVAASQGLAFVLRSPRVFVLSDGVVNRSVDIIDGLDVASDPGAAIQETILGLGASGMALGPNGAYLYTRNTTFTTNNSVQCWYVAYSPPALVGEVVVSATGVGTAKSGITIAPDGQTGWFADEGGIIHSFDANPGSPGFMTLSGQAQLTGSAPQALAVTPDGSALVVVGASSPPGVPSVMAVVDTATMTEIATVTLTDNGSLMGLVDRSAVAVTQDGLHAVTLVQGLYAGPGFLSSAAVNVVDLDPSSPTFLTQTSFLPLQRFGQVDIALDPAPGATRLYTVDTASGGELYLSSIDWTSGLTDKVYLGQGGLGAEAGGVGISGRGNRIWAGAEDDVLRVFDASLNLLGQLTLSSPGTPSRIVIESR